MLFNKLFLAGGVVVAGGGTGVGIYYGVTNGKNEAKKKAVVENQQPQAGREVSQGRADSTPSRIADSPERTGTEEIQS